MVEQLEVEKRWCILRTSASHTLRLVETLGAASIDAWSPRKTIKRPAPGNRRRYVTGERRIMVEVTIPILPGFVFADESNLDDVIRAGALPFGPHPRFSLLQVGDRVPLIRERQIAGLRSAERDADALLSAEREADGREAERKARAARLGTERARRKALRQQHRQFPIGQVVAVDNSPAYAGMEGTVVESRGTTTKVHFGGFMTLTVEAWQVRPVGVQSENTLQREAA